MADTIIDNINSIIRTKSELKSVLTENGQNPSDTFSEYPEMFRSAISTAAASGADEETINSYISAYLNAYNFIDQTSLSANSYITASDIPTVQVPVIDENLIPKETNTYTLGDSSYYYNATYTNSINLTKNTFTNRLYTSGQYSIACEINGGVRYSFMAGSIRPDVSNADLGTSSAKWANTYTENLYAPIVTLSYSYNSIENASNTQINFKVNQWNRMKLTNTALMPSTNNGINLGDSGAQWRSSYVRDLYLNGTNLEDRLHAIEVALGLAQ